MAGQRNISGVPVNNVTGAHRPCYTIDCGHMKMTSDFALLAKHLRECERATKIEYHPVYAEPEIVRSKKGAEAPV